MPTVDPTASNGKISRVRPQQGTGVLKRDSQIMADDSLSAEDKVALINDNRRRRGQSERNFNDYQEAARDAGIKVNRNNPVDHFTDVVLANLKERHSAVPRPEDIDGDGEVDVPVLPDPITGKYPPSPNVPEGLGNATNGIPDLSSPGIELGTSVNLEWEEGLILNPNI
jgi:hypothetical protein